MKRYVRKPAEVTADRLTDHVMQWHDRMDGYERDAFGLVIQVLREIEQGTR